MPSPTEAYSAPQARARPHRTVSSPTGICSDPHPHVQPHRTMSSPTGRCSAPQNNAQPHNTVPRPIEPCPAPQNHSETPSPMPNPTRSFQNPQPHVTPLQWVTQQLWGSGSCRGMWGRGQSGSSPLGPCWRGARGSACAAPRPQPCSHDLSHPGVLPARRDGPAAAGRTDRHGVGTEQLGWEPVSQNSGGSG